RSSRFSNEFFDRLQFPAPAFLDNEALINLQETIGKGPEPGRGLLGFECALAIDRKCIYFSTGQEELHLSFMRHDIENADNGFFQVRADEQFLCLSPDCSHLHASPI